MSKLFQLNQSDFVKGAVSAVIAAVFMSLYSVVNPADGNFDLFAIEWLPVLKMAVNAAIAAFVGYAGKNFLTDSNGTVHLGVATFRTAE